MRTRPPFFTLAAGVVAVLAIQACGDNPADTSTAVGPTTIQAAAPNQACQLKDLAKAARSYFSQPEAKQASDLISDIGDACAGGDQEAASAAAWNAMRLVEQVLEAGTAGAPADGATFLNGLVDCIEALCAPAVPSAIDFAPALSTRGLFAVRGNDQIPAIERAPVAFTDLSGSPNLALWGIEVDADWSYVTANDPTLMYGAPLVDPTLPIEDVTIGDLEFGFHRYPDPQEGEPGYQYRDDALHVGVCFAGDGITMPAGSTLEPRVQREAVLLEVAEPGFCDTVSFPASAQTASFAGFLSSAARLLPSAFRSLFMQERKITAVGGTPLDFSRFAAVAAQTQGTLEFVTQPTDAVEGESFGEIKVRALSGKGTPMEKVLITLSIQANEGEPAGAVLSGDISSYTLEADGVASFPDEGATAPSVGKPGGYTLCATGSLDGFTFAQVCSTRFHVANAN